MDEKKIEVGNLIIMLSMNDPDPIPPGTIGVVELIDSRGTIHVKWENGRSLGVIPGEDKFSLVTE